MEVKVYCQCGSKYKFDVEPVNERMPWPVNCPTCGADGTAQANQIIAQALAANPPPAPAPIVAAALAPMPMAAAAPPVPAPGGLRINKPAPPAAPPPIAGTPPPAGGPPRFTPATSRPLAAPRPAASSESLLKKIGGAVGGVLAVGIIILKVWRIWRIGHAITVGASAPDVQQIAAAMHEATEMNLLVADNNVVLYVKHDDYHEVAQDCMAFWKEKDHRNFQIIPEERATGKGSEYLVYPAHNGYVCVVSGLNWKDPMFESTAQHLSEKYSTTVFDQKDVDEPGEFVFGVYDQGSSVFHARMTESKNGDEHTKVEHVEWAKTHGYKPGSHGNKDFDLLDANTLTKNCGMKFWDQPIIVASNYIVLAAAKK